MNKDHISFALQMASPIPLIIFRLARAAANSRDQPEHLFTWLIISEATNRKANLLIVVVSSDYIGVLVADAPAPGERRRGIRRTPPETDVTNVVAPIAVTVATRESCKTCFVGCASIWT